MAGWEGLTSCPAKKYIFFETNGGNTVHIQCKAGRGGRHGGRGDHRAVLVEG